MRFIFLLLTVALLWQCSPNKEPITYEQIGGGVNSSISTPDFEAVCYTLADGFIRNGFVEKYNKRALVYDSTFTVVPSAIIEDCIKADTDCKRYIPIYFLFDNTGTNASNENTFLLEYADGSSASIVQPPQTNSGGVSKWTNQFNVLEQLIQDEYVKKCGAFVVETRFNPPPFNSTNLATYTPPDGLFVPPSELWGTVPDMKYRYMQINSCSTCSKASIANVKLIAVNGNATDLDMTSVFKVGKETRYDICQECVANGIERMYWYQQTPTLVPESELPVCLLECNETTPSPPESGCIFTTQIVCDSRGTSDLTDDVTITIRYQDCGDGELSIAYFIEEDGGLVLYDDLIDASHIVICGTNNQAEPPTVETECIDFEEICYYIPKVSKGTESGWICQDGTIRDCDLEIVLNAQKLDCACDYSIRVFEMCADLNDDGIYDVNFIREVEQIANCDEAVRTQTDYELDGVTVLVTDISEADVVECEDLTTTCETVCYVCEDFAPVKDGTVKGETKGKTLRKKGIAVTKYSCLQGETLEVKSCGGVIVEVNGEATTSVDLTGFEEIDCEVEICLPDQAVKVLGEVKIDWTDICDTIVCEVVAQPEQTEFLPTTIEVNTWNLSYNGGTADEDNPLLNGETFTPEINQNVHALFSLGLPDCAVINEAYILYDHEGSSGTVYQAFNTSTSATVPNSFNAGANNNTWAWHRGSSSVCTTSGSYTQIEGIAEPCGTARPVRYVSRLDLTATVSDLNALSVTSVYANANLDIFHSIKLIVDYELPEGCSFDSEEGEGIVKVINTQIIAQKAPLEVFGQIEIVQPCDNQTITSTACLDADLPTYSLVAGDAVLFIGQVDCDGNALGGSYYTLDGQTLIEEPVIIDENCVPPELQELQNCVADANGDTYTQIIAIAADGEVLSELYVNTITLTTTNSIGTNFPCPPTSDAFTKNKICAIVDGVSQTGYEITYISAGNVISYFESFDGSTFPSYSEYCCDDCTQISGCFGGRGARFDFFIVAGEQIAVQDLVVDGVPNSPNDLVATINSLYGGDGVFEVQVSICGNTDLNHIELNNVGVIIEGIVTPDNTVIPVNSYGDCTKEASIIACPVDAVLECKNSDSNRIVTEPIIGTYVITTTGSCGTFSTNISFTSEIDAEAQTKAWLDSTLGGNWFVDYTVSAGSIGAIDANVFPSPCRLDNIAFTNSLNQSSNFDFENECDIITPASNQYAGLTKEKNSDLILAALQSLNERKLIEIERCCTYGVAPIDVWVRDYSDGTVEVFNPLTNSIIASPDFSLLNCCKSGITVTQQTNRSFYEYRINDLGVFTKLDPSSPNLAVTWTAGTGVNSAGNDYQVTVASPLANMGAWLQVEGDINTGSGSGLIGNALISQNLSVTGSLIEFTLYTGDDGGGNDDAMRRDIRLFISYDTQVVTDVQNN